MGLNRLNPNLGEIRVQPAELNFLSKSGFSRLNPVFFEFILPFHGKMKKKGCVGQIPYELLRTASGARRLRGSSPSACRAPSGHVGVDPIL